MKAICWGKRQIGLGPVFCVAEIGINHNGDVDLAKQMIEAAFQAGADGVNFKTTERKIYPGSNSHYEYLSQEDGARVAV